MATPRTRVSFLLSLASILVGCAAHQNALNTVQMVESISRIRSAQVVRNLATFVNDRNAVPAQIVLATGQANVSVGVQPALKITNLNRTAAVEGDLGFDDQWTAQWQFTAITDPADLRNLRNLYALMISTDDQYSAMEAVLRDGAAVDVFRGLFAFDGGSAFHGGDSTSTLGGLAVRSGVIPEWQSAKESIIKGDSVGCRQFQAQRDKSSVLPFRRWLYWRIGSGTWQPAGREVSGVRSLGKSGQVERGTISDACFDDFVILVQALSPTSNDVAKQQPRYMLQ